MKVLVLGAGKMMRAVLKGLHGSVNMKNWFIYSPSGFSAKKLAEEVGARSVSHFEELENIDIIFVGCKPYQLQDVAPKLTPELRSKTFISILAILSEKEQREILQVDKLVRIMPNMPIEFNQGVLLVSSQSSKETIPWIKSIFSSCSEIIETNEKEFEELTLLSGSGPALFYRFGELLVNSFQSLSTQQREMMTQKVMIGVGRSLEREMRPFHERIQEVCSKKGVTEKVLKNWESFGFHEMLKKSFLLDDQDSKKD